MVDTVILLVVVCVGVLSAGTLVWVVASALRLLRDSRADGVEVRLVDFIGLHLRNPQRSGNPTPVRNMLFTARRASLAGTGVSVRQIETHTLCGGDPALCIDALIEARARGMGADWMTVCAVDLAGRDPMAAVEAGVNLNRVLGAPEYQGRFLKRPRATTGPFSY